MRPWGAGTGADRASRRPAARPAVRGEGRPPRRHAPVILLDRATAAPAQPSELGSVARGCRWQPYFFLAMTVGAIGQAATIDFVVRQQLLAPLQLIGRRLPSHVEDPVLRAQVFLGCAVAAQAPRH